MNAYTESVVCDVSLDTTSGRRLVVQNKTSKRLTFSVRVFRSPRGTGEPRYEALTLDEKESGTLVLSPEIQLVEIWCKQLFILNCILNGNAIKSGRLNQIQQLRRKERAGVEVPLPRALQGELRVVTLPSRDLAPVFG